MPITVTGQRTTFGALDRSTLVKGVDLPTEENTGTLPGVLRQDFIVANEGLYTMSANEQIRNKNVRGRLKLAPGVVIDNCRIYGSPPPTNPGVGDHRPLLELYNTAMTSATSALVTNTDLTCNPDYEYEGVYGFKGGGATFRFVHISRCVDGGQAFRAPFVIEQSYIHDPIHFTVDRTRGTPDGTHNDGIQFEGGTAGTLTVEGCHIDFTYNPYPTPGTNTGGLTCVIMTNNTGQALGLTLKNNWIRGGQYPFNFAADSNPTGFTTITGNRITGMQWPAGNGTYYHIVRPSAMASTWTFSGNTDWTTGGAVRVANS